MHKRSLCAAILQCCQNCRSLCDEEFKQVVNLKKSGLLIYIYNKDSLHKPKFEGKRCIILHNSGHKELKRFDYIAELCQYKTKCFKCKALLQHIRCLIDNVTTINKGEILGICEHCKQFPKNNKCKRCEYLMYKFLNNETKRYLENTIGFKQLICILRQLLLSVMQGQIICKHNIYLDSESKMQIDKVLKLLNNPVTPRQPNIDFLLDFVNKQKISNKPDNEDENILSELITKIKSENVNYSTLEDELSICESRSTCICKYLSNDKTKRQSLVEKLSITEDSISTTFLETKKSMDLKLKSLSENNQDELPQQTMPNIPKVFTKLKQIVQRKSISNKDKCNKLNVDIKNKIEKIRKEKSPNLDPSKEIMLKMVVRTKKVKNETKSQPDKSEDLSGILNLPVIEIMKDKKEIVLENSESIVECKGEDSYIISEMIKGTKIIPYDRKQSFHKLNNLPMLFKTQRRDFKLPELNNIKSFSTNSNAVESNVRKSTSKNSQANNSGIILYQLSNREFIDKGWTKLPRTKIMRKMNIYKMIPSYTKFDWFKNHKDQKVLFYDSSEKLAEIYENGSGKWFYKNGKLALEYYSAEELNLGKRCIVYSSDDEIHLRKKKSVNVLSCFDYLGNGVVYDSNGNTRLKFNQSEGLLIDKKIGPPGRWKWHTLNEPPILFPVFFNTFVEEEPYLKVFKHRESTINRCDKMNDIDLDNIRRRKEAKMLQEYKSLQIQIKIVKLNNYFTLRIINQAKIYLQFRYERISFKLNVGMLLKYEEILEIDLSEASEVATPYDNSKNKKKTK